MLLRSNSQNLSIKSSQLLVPFFVPSHPTKQLFIYTPTNQICQPLIVKHHNRNKQGIESLIEWRKNTQHPIVKISTFRIEKEVREGLYGIVYVQWCQYLLSDFTEISFTQGLYVIRCALQAMQKLSEKFGYFVLNASMIAISHDNHCKFWVNQKFGEHQKMINEQTQQEMVDKLFSLIELYVCKENQREGDQVQMFFNQIRQNQFTIIKANRFIDIFVYQHHIIVPPYFFEPQRKNAYLQTNIVNVVKRPSISITNFQIKRTQSQEIGSFFDLKQNKLKLSNWSKSSKPKRQKRVFLRQKLKQSKALNNKNKKEKTSWSIENQINRQQTNQLAVSLLMRANPSSSNNSQDFFQDSKNKLSIRSILNMKISSNQTQQSDESNIIRAILQKKLDGFQESQSPLDLQQKLPFRTKSLSNAIQSQMIEKIIADQKLQKNQWTKKLSQLFTFEKNLNESVNMGEDQRPYLKDFKLSKLANFGKLLSTSMIHLQEDDEEQSCFSKKQIPQQGQSPQLVELLQINLD